ncbi:MAG: hypothetical protein KKD56_10495 [Acidobacteria bacterium]|nr:hypothetical protein [Acidobacteriota bacterium]MCG2816016.1 hypothetical protein [Candidatus Aminicenantes bacterium]MBU1339484.1 hypothetical protein [Acidobacteriota bacterium]MBU1474410.1 hypothetical protein [Acidobacteriota bacterium]MBU2437684.1 hypothetical protein [Acidobacteriota bacterium]
MENFLDIPCLDKKEQEELIADIEKSIEEKKKAGLMTEKEIREIEEMRLRPLPDFLDVQVVYEPLDFDD